MEKEYYLTTGEAADWLGVSRATLNKLLRTGEIQAVVFAGMKHRRISTAELKRYVERGQRNG